MENMALDFSLVKQPSLDASSAKVGLKGEMSWHGSGGTPFGPIPLGTYLQKTSLKQFSMHMSDFTLNSMFYHAYKQKKLKMTLSAQQNPEFKNFFRSECPADSNNEICIGSILPEVTSAYPGYR